MQYTHFVFLLISIALPLISNTPPSSTVFIIIHGTWAQHSSWAQPDGDFFTALQDSVKDVTTTVTTFGWSGNLDFESRRTAGHDLANYIRTLSPTTSCNIIGHSHGANVGILACNELANDKHTSYTINAFYALAVPVNTHEYMPNMNIIKALYSFFSCNDLVQPVLGIFGRIYPQHPRIANIRVTLNGKEPDHDQLHSPCIARWLAYIHDYYTTATSAYLEPLTIDFASTRKPRITVDSHRKELLEQDRRLITHLLTVFRTKKG